MSSFATFATRTRTSPAARRAHHAPRWAATSVARRVGARGAFLAAAIVSTQDRRERSPRHGGHGLYLAQMREPLSPQRATGVERPRSCRVAVGAGRASATEGGPGHFVAALLRLLGDRPERVVPLRGLPRRRTGSRRGRQRSLAALRGLHECLERIWVMRLACRRRRHGGRVDAIARPGPARLPRRGGCPGLPRLGRHGARAGGIGCRLPPRHGDEDRRQQPPDHAGH